MESTITNKQLVTLTIKVNLHRKRCTIVFPHDKVKLTNEQLLQLSAALHRAVQAQSSGQHHHRFTILVPCEGELKNLAFMTCEDIRRARDLGETVSMSETISMLEHVHLTESKQELVVTTTEEIIQVTPPVQQPVTLDPPLSVVCGPLLNYDTVKTRVKHGSKRGTWRGTCMIITDDSKSVYDPVPALTLVVPSKCKASVSPAKALHRRVAADGSFTFWRWTICIALADEQMKIHYSINKGPVLDFFVPSLSENMRVLAYSCNGFSTDVTAEKEALYKGPGFNDASDPLWADVKRKHAKKPFHVMVGGGDQLYCDVILDVPEIKPWATMEPVENRLDYDPDANVQAAVENFFFWHNVKAFSRGLYGWAVGAMPRLNQPDDHDTIDGFGSYPDPLQRSPMFMLIGKVAAFYIRLFQHSVVDAVDFDKEATETPFESFVFGGVGPYVGFPSLSILTYLGPNVYMLLLDTRTERTLRTICSGDTYNSIAKAIRQLPTDEIQHIVVQTGIPLAYPRMNFAEKLLGHRNPLFKLKLFSSMLNKFNDDAELLDDLNDQWTAMRHKKERNDFVLLLQDLALEKGFRFTFLSGDVHCTAVGVFKTLKTKHCEVEPIHDHRYMLNIVSSAIVNVPPPGALMTILGQWSKREHDTLHPQLTDETMIPLFKKDTDGSRPRSKRLLGRRNYCIFSYDNGVLIFDIRVEQTKGHGRTVGYPIGTPPPMWKTATEK